MSYTFPTSSSCRTCSAVLYGAAGGDSTHFPAEWRDDDAVGLGHPNIFKASRWMSENDIVVTDLRS
jgi:hypothetical protein